jgi:hypothetical protein
MLDDCDIEAGIIDSFGIMIPSASLRPILSLTSLNVTRWSHLKHYYKPALARLLLEIAIFSPPRGDKGFS